MKSLFVKSKGTQEHFVPKATIITLAIYLGILTVAWIAVYLIMLSRGAFG